MQTILEPTVPYSQNISEDATIIKDPKAVDKAWNNDVQHEEGQYVLKNVDVLVPHAKRIEKPC